MPEYHRIRTLILVGSILGDWEEADNCRRDAWALYKTVRRWHPKGKDRTADGHLDDLRAELEDLDEALESDAPGWDEEVDEDEDVPVSNDEDFIEDARAELESLDMADTAPSAIAASADVAEPATTSTAAVESGTVYVPPEQAPNNPF
ncbi:hypothetical protein C7974DRAFT_135509 [Boeremia exigua]|uniref:uncharacterized protein n=1 Tax=Boeremia exigua TaxID=749465 RepID=UPI001E8EEA7E|nr:uncharacterized protein C7974DRAFT_135509 [Boeremia exigua]KAH6639617.1 hypothetical protein C7974DRAFT_135509 [Boeremia exigua]